jgi:hypothetical protein
MCQVLFISNTDEKKIRKLLERLEGLPVLTISDSTDFIQKGGMIEFNMINDHIRFSINYLAAHNAGISFSAQMLKLAKKVIK